ncbi:MAG: DNA polymerase I, partial [Candidatus Omnitrophica bacterium]|nr:DNA polymerase I [Candidatus Omnitrophota bacterium]
MNLYLIDGNFLCYRAYYAISSLTNSRGKPTNAVYGFITTLNKLIKEKKPDLLAVCFDSKGLTFRHKEYAEYKAHRKPMPEDLVSQLPLIKEAVGAYSICSFEKTGFEADDIIATLAVQGDKRGMEVYIVTADKDALQLVNDNIKVYNPYKQDLVYDIEQVRQRYGSGPEAVVEIMSLSGDSADNVPGVPGIGDKTAANLIKEYKTLDLLLSHVDEIKGKTGQKLKEYADQARLSHKLVTLKKDVPLEIDWEKLKAAEPDQDRLIELFKELELKSLLKDVARAEGKDKEYKLIQTADDLQALINNLKKQKTIAFNLQTVDSDPMQTALAGISFCWQKDEACYLPLTEEILEQLRPIFEDEGIAKIGQDIKFQVIVLADHGLKLSGQCFDTMIASYLLNPAKGKHNLEDIAVDYLGYKITSYTDLAGRGKKQLNIENIPLEDLSSYSSEYSETVFRLKQIQEEKLLQQDLGRLYYDIEMPVCFVLSAMEQEGVAVDLEYLKVLSAQLQTGLEKLTSDIYKEAGEEFNINSPKQLRSILFDKLKLPVVKKTKTGASTNVEVLQRLADKHALPALILKYRGLAKLKTGYVDALPLLVNPRTGRIHTSYNQTITATGRLSSSEPNLQNIPVRTEEGRKIRQVFIPRAKDRLLLSADYSQIELRVLAHVCQDEALIEAFKQDEDVHSYTASLVFNVDLDKVTPQMRMTAKTVNFGIVYGMSPYGLSKDLDIDITRAKDFIDTYFQRYPGVKEYMDAQVAKAGQDGFVTTLMSRRRYIEGIKSPDNFARQFAERTAINTPIQGSAADIIKKAMIDIQQEIKQKDMRSVMIMQVHDELVFDMPKAEEQALRELVKEQMEGVIDLKVPLKVDITVG